MQNKVTRRTRDPARLVAADQKAKDILGWEPETKELRDIIESA